jgi:translation initiation factor 3 subunit G
VQVTRKTVRVNRNVEARRQWAKFGDCKGVPRGIEANVTYVSENELIDLSDLRPKRKDEIKTDDGLTLLKERGSSSIVQCQNCGEKGHWTRHCPKSRKAGVAAAVDPSADKKDAGKAGAGTGSKYTAPHLRAGADPTRKTGVTMLRDDTATLRVTNLSEDTKEQDLRELFQPFGHVTRIYLAKDKKTNESRGFAFVNYADKRSAQGAIDKLNGYGYDNLILRVEWAKPREGERDADK